MLYLVKYDRWWIQLQEPARIFRCRGAYIRQIQRDVAVLLPKDMLQQCGLAGLARSGQDDGGERPGCLLEHRFQGSSDVGLAHYWKSCSRNAKCQPVLAVYCAVNYSTGRVFGYLADGIRGSVRTVSPGT